MLRALGIEPVSIWLSGRPYEHLREIRRAGRSSPCPTAVRRRETLAKRLGVKLVEAELPFGLEASRRFVELLGREFGSEDKARAFIEAELDAVVPRLEWSVPHAFANRRFAFAGDPHYAEGFAEVVEELGGRIVATIVMGRTGHLNEERRRLLEARSGTVFEPDRAKLRRLFGATTRWEVDLLVCNSRSLKYINPGFRGSSSAFPRNTPISSTTRLSWDFGSAHLPLADGQRGCQGPAHEVGGAVSALNVAPARALLAEGRLEECAREISRLIASKPAWPKGSPHRLRPGPTGRSRLTIAVASPRGKVVLAVRRMEDESVLGAYILEYRAALDCARSVSVPALFHLRRLPGSAGTRLSAEEKPELENLSTGLCLLFESLRGRSGGGTGLIVQAETHEAGREGLERILRITSACNHRCPFCFVPVNAGGADRAEFSSAKLDALAPVLGPHGTVVISGGEPTVDPRLVDIIASARRRGLRRFVLQTNGAALVRPGLMESLLALGVEGFDVSFHAHKPSSHARITGNRDTFPKVVEGLGRLLDSGRCRVTACVLVNAWNYRELPQLVGFLGKLSRERLKRERAVSRSPSPS